MDQEIARLRHLLEEAERRQREEKQLREEEQRLRQEEQRLREEEQRLREEEQQRRKEAEKYQEEAKQQLEPNSLFGLLDTCHNLSQALRVETNATLTTQGGTTNTENRRFPRLLRPWSNFPTLQEKVWDKLNGDPTFTSARLFPSNHQLQFVQKKIEHEKVYSENSLRSFQRDTVDTFVGEILEALTKNENLCQQFRIKGRVTLQDRPDAEHSDPVSLEDALEHVHLDGSPHQVRRTTRGRRRRGPGPNAQELRPKRRRNRRADQFCVHLVDDERRIPVYAVEFKAPHKLTLPEIIAGLHEVDIARDVIDQQGDTFEFHATHLVAAVLTQLFSYMLDIGVRNGILCTGEAYIFVQIPVDDPTILEYYMSVPRHDVEEDNEFRLHRTAVGQVLSFTLNALVAESPSQEWHDAANKRLSTWDVQYIDILRDIPESMRKEPPPSNYKPSYWKPVNRSPYNTRAQASCRSNWTTPRHSSGESSGSENDFPSPSPKPESYGQPGSNDQVPGRQKIQAKRGRRGRGRGRGRGRERRCGEVTTADSNLTRRRASRPYCTTACIRGLLAHDYLDPRCPNVHEHGVGRHPFGAKQFTRRLHNQLLQDRESGFEQLHICGRTGFILKATLLSHGYTVVIKATSAQKEAGLQREISIYHHLRSLQGKHIPVCVGHFRPDTSYWYHGQRMTLMMVLGWSGIRVQNIVNKENELFLQTKRQSLLQVLQSHGVLHGDSEWRNMLWDFDTGRAFMIDLEDVSWMKRGPANNSSTIHLKRKRRRYSANALPHVQVY
jgi:hypothetical protein